MKMPNPNRNKSQLLSALASVAWWRSSIRGFANIVEPLFTLSGERFNVKKDWNDTHTAAWTALKVAVSEATCRYAADVNKQKLICTDACQGSSGPDGHNGGLAGWVSQIDPVTGMLQPLGFFARPLANDIPDDRTDIQLMIIRFYHEAASHPGGTPTWMLLRQKYVWKEGKMKRQIQKYCDLCSTCIRFKSGNHAQGGCR